MIWKVCVIWKWSTRYGMILCRAWSLFSPLISYCYWLLDIEKDCFQWEKLWNQLWWDFNKTGKFSLCLEEKKLCCRDSRFPSNILLATLPIIKLPNERWWSKVQQWFLFYQSAHLWRHSKKRKILWDYLPMNSRLYISLFCFSFWLEIFL